MTMIKEKNPLTEEMYSRIINTLLDSFNGSKEMIKDSRHVALILELSASLGLRISEILSLSFADFKYDDGKEPNKGILEAELVLIGISRTSKTPLSMYLANRNIKVANVPLVPEIPVPKEVYEIDPKKIIGLTNSPEVLNNVRTTRLKALGLSSNASYAKLDRILEELEYADKVMKKLGCPVINVANKAIEETAGDILDIMKEKGIHKWIHKDS